MGRPSNPLFPYTIKPHTLNVHVYASTQVPRVDEKTGKKIFRHVHWGTLTDNVFHPFSEFILLPPAEREKYIFPEGCDTSELQRLSGMRSQGRPEYSDEARNRLYGDIWLLEQVAEKTGVRHDLMVAFDENREMVDAVMTLSFRSSLDILDEMQSIRCVEHTNHARLVTPFVGMQNDICEAFGFTPPKGCERKYVSKEVAKRRRGRPGKPVVEQQ